MRVLNILEYSFFGKNSETEIQLKHCQTTRAYIIGWKYWREEMIWKVNKTLANHKNMKITAKCLLSAQKLNNSIITRRTLHFAISNFWNFCNQVFWCTGESNGTPLQYSCLENPMDGGAWWATVHGVAKSRTRLRDFTFTFHCHALEKEMATHSSVLAWRIPGAEKPGGLPSKGSPRVGHDWSNLAAAAACWRTFDNLVYYPKVFTSTQRQTLYVSTSEQRWDKKTINYWSLYSPLSARSSF